MKKNILIILSLFFFTSCDIITKKFQEKNNEKNQNFDFQNKVFQGNIGKSNSIEMILTKNGSKLSGKYKYTRKNSYLDIKGEISKDGNFKLNEFNSKGNMTGIFEGSLDNKSATGSWKKPDGSSQFNFSLFEESEIKISEIKFEGFYTGSINNKYKIEMYLNEKGNLIEGKYRYTRKNNFLNLKGEILLKGKRNKIILNEFNKHGSISGVFEGNLTGNNISGIWKKPDGSKQMDFSINRAKKGTQNKVTCNEEDLSEDVYNSVVDANINNEKSVYTCKYRNIKVVKTSEINDYRGFTSEYSVLYIKKNKEYERVKNSQIFNINQDQLIKKINRLIKEDYMKYYDASEDCFDPPEYMVFKIDELEIGFSEKGIQFFADWGFPNACRSVNYGSTISFSFEEIEPFLKN